MAYRLYFLFALCFLSAVLAPVPRALAQAPRLQAAPHSSPKQAEDKALNMNFMMYESFVKAAEEADKPGKIKSAALPERENSSTALDFSFGGDDDGGDDSIKRLDGGLNKDSSPNSVGLRHSFGNNWQIGGGAVFDGKGRGAQADFGYKW